MPGAIRYVLALAALLVAQAASAEQCVPYAREESGLGLFGDAWKWWDEAAGLYERGHSPLPGAVIVFRKFGHMRRGHVAVVAAVLGPRDILVDHANWAPRHGFERGEIARMVAVRDVSARNDWTRVRVWNEEAQDFGPRLYPTYGFIYQPGSRALLREVSDAAPVTLPAWGGTLAWLAPPAVRFDEPVPGLLFFAASRD